METERTAEPTEVRRPVEEELALAEAELAALPGLVDAATAEGQEDLLSRLLARRPILEHKIAYLKGTRDQSWQKILDAHLAAARDRYQQVKAEQAGIIAELEGRLAEANAKAAAAWAEVTEARWAAEEEQRRKPDWWWKERNLAVPEATPVADRVKERAVADSRYIGFLADHGDKRFEAYRLRSLDNSGRELSTTQEERVPVPPVVQDIIDGTHQGLGSE